MRRRTSKSIRKASPISNRRAPANLPALPTSRLRTGNRGRSAHAAWASAIARKFSLKVDLQGMFHASLVDLALRERCAILSNSSAGPFHHQHHSTAHNTFKNINVQRILPEPARLWRAGSERITQESRGGNSSPFLTSSTPVAKHFSLLSSSAEYRGDKRKSSEEAEDSSFVPIAIHHIAVPNHRLRRERLEHLGENFDDNLVTRIARKHRRKEFAQPGMSREFTPGLSPLLPYRPALTVEQQFATPGGNRRAKELPGRSTVNGEGAAALNFIQLADEVVKQLDRRLIAARERMGRI